MHNDSKYLKPIEKKIILKVAGKEIDMVPFVHDSFRDMILAFIRNLKDTEEGKVEIVIK